MEEHSFAIQLTGKIMVIAVIILFLLVVLVLIFQLYIRWFWSDIDESTPTSAGRRRSGQESAGRKGLDPAVLRSIPVLIFEPKDFREGLECAVCLSELSQGEKARLLPICNHGFHVDCIDMWFNSNSTCPLCRNPVEPTSSNPTDSQLPENLDSGSPSESPIFPTNVLFWGNQTQVSSRGVCLEEAPTTSLSPANTRPDAVVAIDIPTDCSASSSGGCSADVEMKSPVTTRLRTLKRLLSRERRVSDSSSAADLEQAVGR